MYVYVCVFYRPCVCERVEPSELPGVCGDGASRVGRGLCSSACTLFPWERGHSLMDAQLCCGSEAPADQQSPK